jgi:uncharacterized repeat protein (TIGR03806 family)
MPNRSAALTLVAAGLVLAGCEEDPGPSSVADGPVDVDVEASPPDHLSSMRLFDWSEETGFVYNERVVPYELNTPLFSDFALKERAVYIPEGAAAIYDAQGIFTFPVGTVIAKTFYFPEDFRSPGDALTLIETRVLLHTSSGWESWPYLWDEDQRDARLAPGGATRSIRFVGADGMDRTANYLVPQRNQCRSCHERNVGAGGAAAQTPIGPAARHLNREYDYGDGAVSQLEHLASLGMLEGMPAIAEVPVAFDFRPIEAGGVAAVAPEDLDFAARSYLDINCAHCHSPEGTQGVTSQLFLNHDNEDAFNLGVCKRPGSAGGGTFGLDHDLVPGDPDMSILYRRVDTEDVGAMMPLLGRSLRHEPGSELLRAWIAAMPPVDCAAMPAP